MNSHSRLQNGKCENNIRRLGTENTRLSTETSIETTTVYVFSLENSDDPKGKWCTNTNALEMLTSRQQRLINLANRLLFAQETQSVDDLKVLQDSGILSGSQWPVSIGGTRWPEMVPCNSRRSVFQDSSIISPRIVLQESSLTFVADPQSLPSDLPFGMNHHRLCQVLSNALNMFSKRPTKHILLTKH